MKTISFCTQWHRPDAVADKDGLCGHGFPMRGAPMKCIHCTRAETISYGDACPQCGNPAVGEFGEPVIVLEADEESAVSSWTGTSADCDCVLRREKDGSVRLFMCKLHHRAKKLEDSFEEICTQMGCELKDIPDKFVQICKERDEALGALGVDDDLEGDKLTEALKEAKELTNPEVRDGFYYLLDLVGMTEHELTCERRHWGAVEFLVSRLRALAPDKLAKELRPKTPRQRRSRKIKVKAEKPDATEALLDHVRESGMLSEAPRLRLVRR